MGVKRLEDYIINWEIFEKVYKVILILMIKWKMYYLILKGF